MQWVDHVHSQGQCFLPGAFFFLANFMMNIGLDYTLSKINEKDLLLPPPDVAHTLVRQYSCLILYTFFFPVILTAPFFTVLFVKAHECEGQTAHLLNESHGR